MSPTTSTPVFRNSVDIELTFRSQLWHRDIADARAGKKCPGRAAISLRRHRLRSLLNPQDQQLVRGAHLHNETAQGGRPVSVLPSRLEVEAEGELAETAFVVIATQGDAIEASFFRDDGKRGAQGAGSVEDRQARFVDVEVVVVEEVEGFGTKLEVCVFGEAEALGCGGIGIPGPGAAKFIAAGHVGGEWAEVVDAGCRVKGYEIVR